MDGHGQQSCILILFCQLNILDVHVNVANVCLLVSAHFTVYSYTSIALTATCDVYTFLSLLPFVLSYTNLCGGLQL